MPRSRTLRRLLLGFLLYLSFCTILAILLAGAALAPTRRLLTPDDDTALRGLAHSLDSDLADVSITTPDNVILRASIIRPDRSNGNAVILLHGAGDNRMGMTGYAQLLLAHGYTVLLPDARGHGESGGDLASYGLIERHDIRQWFDFLAASPLPHRENSKQAPARCIYGLGESMGAAQLLQSLPQTRFCAVAAESSFSNFREIAYDRMGQPFHLGPWVGRTVLRPVVEIAFLRARWKFHVDIEQASPEDAVAATRVPVFLIHGQVDGNIPLRHARRIHERYPSSVLWEVPHAEHCGALAVAPQEFEQRLLAWFSDHSQIH
jgi:uncharacterized protein